MPKKVSGNKGGAAKRPRLSPSGYELPEPIRAGEILMDPFKKQWKIGTSIGTGGFGEIYRASDDLTKPVGDDAPYAVKIEPHNNGPLFVEMHVYIKVAKAEIINEWMRTKNLKFLGMPKFISNGSHDYNGSRYRFMVMERFGDDLQKLFEAERKKFSIKTVLSVGVKVLDVLEYIHHTGYIHGDIKGSNLLRGPTQSRINEIFLVDYGLACRYKNGTGEHKEYKEDPRKAHDGTIEFTSRDAHIGAHSRRGDLEILGYNMIHWLCGKLPWEDNLKDQNYVHQEKERAMKNIPVFVKKCLKSSPIHDVVQLFLEHVASLSFVQEPDYNLCREIFKNGLKKVGATFDGKLEFSGDKKIAVTRTRTRSRSRKTSQEDEETENNTDLKPAKAPRSSPCQPCRPAQTNRMRKTAAASNRSRKNSKTEIETVVDEKPIIENPTPAMLEIMKKKQSLKRPVEKSKSTTVTPPKRKKEATPVVIKQSKSSAASVAKRPASRPRRVRSPVKSADISPELF